jgi:hypothetical protein
VVASGVSQSSSSHDAQYFWLFWLGDSDLKALELSTRMGHPRLLSCGLRQQQILRLRAARSG